MFNIFIQCDVLYCYVATKISDCSLIKNDYGLIKKYRGSQIIFPIMNIDSVAGIGI